MTVVQCAIKVGIWHEFSKTILCLKIGVNQMVRMLGVKVMVTLYSCLIQNFGVKELHSFSKELNIMKIYCCVCSEIPRNTNFG